MSYNKEIKAGAGYMIGNIFIKGISFVTLPVFTRIMNPYDFGLYNTYVAYEAIITIIIGLGLNATIKNAKFDYSGNLNIYVSTVCSLTVFMSIMIFGFSVMFNNIINTITGFTTNILILLVLQSFGSAIVNIKNAEFSLEYEYKNYLKIAGINTFLNVLLSIIFITLFFKENAFLGRTLGSAIPLFIIGLCFCFGIFKKNKEKLFDVGMARYSLIIGVPLIWHYLSQQIASQFDRIMITNMVGPSSTAVYGFIYTIANIFAILFYSTDNAWSIWFFSQMEEKKYEDIHKKSVHYMIFMTSIACVMIVFSREMIWLLGTKNYVDGANIFIPIIVGMFFLFLYTFPAGIEYYYKKTKYIASLTFVSAILNIILNYIFIKMCGYKAAAYTTMICYFIMFVCHWCISRKILLKNEICFFYKFREFLLSSVVLVIVGIIVIFLNSYIAIKYSLFSLFFAIIIYLKKGEIKKLKVYLTKF